MSKGVVQAMLRVVLACVAAYVGMVVGGSVTAPRMLVRSMADPLLPVTGIVMAAMTPGPNVLLIVGVLLAGIFVARRWPMWVSAALVVVFALIGGMLVAAWRVP